MDLDLSNVVLRYKMQLPRGSRLSSHQQHEHLLTLPSRDSLYVAVKSYEIESLTKGIHPGEVSFLISTEERGRTRGWSLW